MKTLLVLNDPPYGTERSYTALRLAGSLARREGEEVRLFLIGDAAACAKAGQKVPQGYYNIADMLGAVIRRRGEAAVCGSCMDARGMTEADLAADDPDALVLVVRVRRVVGAGRVLPDERGEALGREALAEIVLPERLRSGAAAYLERDRGMPRRRAQAALPIVSPRRRRPARS